ncbi:MAG: lysophospholipase [Ruminococcaceae bacterium]|nr:lysophospholipase [Oscillospiraceae bacterium]
MKTILFQGDSITDMDRSRENDNWLGCGYVSMVAGKMGMENPGAYRFLNRGISGNRLVDLYARIKADCWNLNPDVLSILIGCNDVGLEIHFGNGVDAVRFERVYDMLLTDTFERLPDCKIMLLEPFLMNYTDTERWWPDYRAEVEKRAAIVKKMADRYNLIFVPLQKAFDEACETCHVSQWTPDGVHPSHAGAAIIAEAWMKAYKENFED